MLVRQQHLGMTLGAMSQETHDLILAAALISITLHPFVFKLIDRMGAAPDPARIARAEAKEQAAEAAAQSAAGH